MNISPQRKQKKKCTVISNNYSPKAKLILLNNPREQSRGDYSTVVYTHSAILVIPAI